ncbi:MAG: DUF4337 domain-containing protein [Armatimonadota bacterium]|nr:DUF4337 domain-containing protein [Armatimonadota bacterium]
MPDEIEVPLEHAQEHIEKAHEEHQGEGHGESGGEGKGKDGWTRFIAVLTALLAVVAAIGALKSGLLVNEALLAKNDALLQKSEQVKHLTQKSDSYNYYQAEGIKALIYQTTAQSLPPGSPSAQEDRSQARHYKEKQAAIKKQADAEDVQSQRAEEAAAKANEESANIMEKHHMFAFSVSLCQIAIALSAVAALTRSRRVWFFGLAAGIAGTAALVGGFLGLRLPFAF